MTFKKTQDDFINMDNTRAIWGTLLDALLSPEDSKAFKDKTNARIMAEPDFEEDHLMKDSDLNDMARQAFWRLSESDREPYADLIANLPK